MTSADGSPNNGWLVSVGAAAVLDGVGVAGAAEVAGAAAGAGAAGVEVAVV